MPSVSRPRALAYLVVVLALLALGGRYLVGTLAQPEAAAETPALALDATSVEEEPAASLVVHVAGAVRRPGLFELPEGSRIDDAIREAGGAKPRADLSLVNLAAPVADLSAYGEVAQRDGDRVTLRVTKADTPKVTARLLADLPVVDLTVADPPVDEVIERVFAVEEP